MAELLVTAEFPMTGADAGDKAVNNFTFHKEGAYVPGEATGVMGQVIDFYNAVGAQVGAYLAAHLDRGANMSMVKAYDITGKLANRGPDANGKEQGPAPHGSPIASQAFTLAAALSPQDLPFTAAVAITLRARNALAFPVEAPDQGDPGFEVDRPRQRRTGRLYLGPCNFAALGGAADGNMGIKAAARTTFLQACEDLQDAVNDLGYAWVVWSRQNAAVSVIERVECDNSWDTIRRRKSRPTVRDVRTFAPVPPLALGA